MAISNIDIQTKIDGIDPTIDKLVQLKQADANVADQFKKTNKDLNDQEDHLKKNAAAAATLHGSLTKVGEGARGLTGILSVLGRVFGINTEEVKALMEVHSGLREAMRSVNEVSRATEVQTKAMTVATEANTIATEEQTVANEEQAASQLATLGPIGLVIAAIGALAVGIYEYVEAKKDQKIIDEAHKDSIKETIKLDKELYDAQLKLSVLEGTTGKTAAEQKKVQDDLDARRGHAAAQQSLALSALGEEPENPGSVAPTGLSVRSVYNAKLKAYQEYIDKKTKIDTDYNHQSALINQIITTDEKTGQETLSHDLEKLRLEDFYKEKLAKDAQLTDEKDRKQKELRDKKDEDIALLEFDKKYNKDNVDLDNEKIRSILAIYEIEKKGLEENHEKELKEYDKFLKEMEKKYDEWLKAKTKAFEDANKEEEEFNNKHIANIDAYNTEQTKLKVQRDKIGQTSTDSPQNKIIKLNQLAADQKVEIDTETEAKINQIQLDAIKEREKINATTGLTDEQRQKQKIQLELDTDDKIKDVQLQAGMDELAITKSTEDQKAEIRKAANKKFLKESEEAIKEVSDYIIKAELEQSEAVVDANNYRLDQVKSAQQTQATLAAAGLKNDLAFEEQRQNALEQAQIKEKMKQKKLKELEILFNAVASFANNSSNPAAALGKALALLAGTNAAGAAFAEEGGIIGENVPMYSPFSRMHRGGGDVLLHAQTGEGIFSRKEMANFGSKNFKSLKSFLNVPYHDNLAGMSSPIIINDNSAVVSRLERLEKAITEKKETTLDVDQLNRWVVTERERGKITRTTHNRGLIKGPRK